MKNLNKFTKDELIKQYKKLENLNKVDSNQSPSKYQWIFNIIDKILLFKSLIIKMTLIGIIIRWIKKYSLVKKLWHIFSLIGSSLLSISLIDIYSWDFISWIKETSIYKWYFDLFSKTELPHEISSKNSINISKGTSIETNGLQTESEINNRINKWFNKEEIDKQEVLTNEEINKFETNNHNYKYYFILGTLIITTGIVWYYWNDIRPAAGDAGNTIIEKIRSFRSWFNSDTNNIINNNPGNNTTNIPTNVNPSNEDIQLVDNNPPKYSPRNLQERLSRVVQIRHDQETYFRETSENIPSSIIQSVDSSSKGKAVLTSPSLENLNEQAESSWNSGVSSPDSYKTVTPASISESNISSSSSSSTSSNINTISTVSNFMKNNWRNRLNEETNDKINFIESSLINNKEDISLVDYFAYIINEYNVEIQTYKFIKNNSKYTLDDLNYMKESIYYFREWISNYLPKIFPESTVSIEIGSLSDSPKLLNKNID